MPETGVDPKKTVAESRSGAPPVQACWLDSRVTEALASALEQLSIPEKKVPIFDNSVAVRARFPIDLAAKMHFVWLSVLDGHSLAFKQKLILLEEGDSLALAYSPMHDEITTSMKGGETTFALCSGGKGQQVLTELVRCLGDKGGKVCDGGDIEVNIGLGRYCDSHLFDGIARRVISGYESARLVNNRDGVLPPLVKRAKDAVACVDLFIGLLGMSPADQVAYRAATIVEPVAYDGLWRALLARGMKTNQLIVGSAHYPEQLRLLKEVRGALEAMINNMESVHIPNEELASYPTPSSPVPRSARPHPLASVSAPAQYRP